MSTSLRRLNVEAEKAAAAAETAKQLVRSAKTELKKARKLSKTAKKVAKLARKKVEAAQAADAPADHAKTSKSLKSPSDHATRLTPKRRPRTKGLQSASEVAKAVITRMSVSGRAKHSAMDAPAVDSPGIASPADGPLVGSPAGPPAGSEVIHAASARVDAVS